MSPYTKEEIEAIEKSKKVNDTLEEWFNTKREEWNQRLEPLYKVLTIDLNQSVSTSKILNAQSEALIFRQEINDNINLFLNKRSKETSKSKKLRQEKFLFYSMSFGLKTNVGEKVMLIDAHLCESDRTVEIIDSYIDFLRSTSKNLDSFSYSIKNMIDLLNYLGK